MPKPLAQVPSDHTIRVTEEDHRTTMLILRPDGSVMKEMAPPRLEGHDTDDDD